MPAVAQVLASVGETARNKGLAAARKLWWEEGGWFDVMRDRPEECRAVSQIGKRLVNPPYLTASLSATVPA